MPGPAMGWSTRRVVALAMVTAIIAAGLASVGSTLVAAQTAKPEATPAGELSIAAASVGGRTASKPGGGRVTFVGAPRGRGIPLADPGATPAASADAFVDQYGAAFGEPDARRDLRNDRNSPMSAGGASIGYQQLEGGVPVFAGELRVQVGGSGKVRSAAGELSTGSAVDTEADVSATSAADTAVGAVADVAGVDAATLDAAEPELWVYDASLIDEPAGPRLLVWRIAVTSSVTPVNRLVLIDAHSGGVALQIEQLRDAKKRRVCNDRNVIGRPYTCPNALAPVVRTEGDGPVANPDVNAAYDLSGATYDYYFTRFARDSINGTGLTLRSTVRHCPSPSLEEPDPGCPYPNAFWDGNQLVYGATYASADDVVGHELTHGVTQYESNLVYANQSGAINESLSDVFGEFVDLEHASTIPDTAANRWLMGEDLPIGAIRDMENPPAYGDPDRMSTFVVLPNTPAGDSGGVHTNSGINNKAAFLMTDGGTFNGQTITGLGAVKVGRIYYEAQTDILTSGSNYMALGNALNQACTNVIGVDGITAGDCTQVAKAVTATEMVPVPPANDNFANATTIAPTSGTTTGATTNASRETGEPGHWTGTGATPGTASIWFKFTAGSNGTATLTTCNSSFDTILAVYTGAAVSALTRVADNDDSAADVCSSTLQSRVTFAAVQGTTYRIAVDGYGANKGAVALNWTIPAAPAGPTGVSGTVTEMGSGALLPGAFVAVLKTSDFSIAGGGVADGMGNYSAQVPAGSYYLYVIDPAGTHTTAFFGSPTVVPVVAGAMTDRDPALVSSRGTIAGTITQDSPSSAIPGAWAVALNGSSGSPESAGLANAMGQFTVPGLNTGNHLMVYVDPAGTHSPEFFPNSPSAGGAIAVTVSGATTTTANGSLSSQAPTMAGAALTGTITDSATAGPLQNVLVIAMRASDFGFAVGGLTNASGQYSLNVTPGAGYKLEFVDTTGLHDMEWFDNQPYFNLGGATTRTAPAVSNAGLAPRTGSITGTVTDDVTAANVSSAWVLAIGSNGIAKGAVTAANGTYVLSGLPAGPYRVAFVDPVGGRTQEYFQDSPDYANASPIDVIGGTNTPIINAQMHHP